MAGKPGSGKPAWTGADFAALGTFMEELEDDLIAAVDLSLNLEGNSRSRFHQVLTQTRARCVMQANALPVLSNPGIGGR